MKKNKFLNNNLLWKVYLIFFIVIMVYSYARTFRYLGLINLIDFILSFPSLIALYGLAISKKMLKAVYWKIYFYFFVLWNIAINIVIPNLQTTNYVYSDFLGILITLPLYIALYLYAFSSFKK